MTTQEALEAIQNARLEWAMVCECTCPACDKFYETISDIEDALAVTPSETKGNQAEAGARKDTEITAPTPRGSLPNSLGSSIEMVIWSCSKCGAIQSFPYNEQPLAYFKCLMGTPNRTMCGGIIKPDFAPQSDRASETACEHDYQMSIGTTPFGAAMFCKKCGKQG